MWRLLTRVIADQIYAYLHHKKLLPEEQKGCRKGSRGTNDLLYIDKAVIVFVLILVPLSLILRNAKGAYEFSESKEKINHLLYMDDLELYS